MSHENVPKPIDQSYLVARVFETWTNAVHETEGESLGVTLDVVGVDAGEEEEVVGGYQER